MESRRIFVRSLWILFARSPNEPLTRIRSLGEYYPPEFRSATRSLEPTGLTFLEMPLSKIYPMTNSDHDLLLMPRMCKAACFGVSHARTWATIKLAGF